MDHKEEVKAAVLDAKEKIYRRFFTKEQIDEFSKREYDRGRKTKTPGRRIKIDE
jgi:hypothetical protein